MLWKNGRQSLNIKDLRGLKLPGGKKGGGIGIVLLVLVGLYLGIDPATVRNLADGISQEGPQQQTSVQQTTEEKELVEFVSVVLADTEDTWKAIFTAKGGTYQEPKLVLYRGYVNSACGHGQSEMGPFYCPADRKIYIDLGFYQDLKNHFDAPGDFAQAYVIAHEVGHHVQKLMGLSDKVAEARSVLSTREFNKVSVKMELQADCFAGIWANHADKLRHIVEQGDIAEALQAASQIGDDQIQRLNQGYVTPDSFTHGSSKQRVKWFTIGYTNGILGACDTF
jgi:predicted metalloprotease